ncbi:MFS transporter [Oceanithermus sp.]
MNPTLRYTLAGFSALFLIGAFVATPGAVLPQWRAEFGVTSQVAWYFNLQLLGLVLGVSAASRTARRHPLFAAAAAIFGLAYLAMAAAPAFGLVALAAAPAGFAMGVLNIHANGLVGDLHPERRVLMVNRANAFFGVGAVGAPLLLTLAYWRSGFVLLGLLFIVAAALAWQAPPAARRRGGGRRPRGRVVLPLLLAVGLYVAVEASLSAWSGTYLTSLGYPLELTGLLLSSYWLLLTLSRLFVAPWVAGNPLPRLVELTAGSLAVLAAIFWPPLAPLFPLAAVFFGPIFGTSFAHIQSLYGQEATGGMFYAAAVGSSLGPAAFALIKDPRRLPAGFILLGALLLVAVYAAARRSQSS